MKKILNILPKWLGSLFSLNLPKICYDSIDVLSQYNWEQIHKDKDYKYLIKPYYLFPVRISKLSRIFERIFDQYVKELHPSVYLEIKELEKERVEILTDLILTKVGLTHLHIRIQIINDRIKKLSEETVKGKTNDELLLDRYKTFIDPKKASVRQYYNYLKGI